MILLRLVACEPDPDCAVVDDRCAEAVCVVCTAAMDDGWVQCTDGWELSWNQPTGGANDLTFDQAMVALDRHTSDHRPSIDQ